MVQGTAKESAAAAGRRALNGGEGGRRNSEGGIGWSGGRGKEWERTQRSKDEEGRQAGFRGGWRLRALLRFVGFSASVGSDVRILFVWKTRA